MRVCGIDSDSKSITWSIIDSATNNVTIGRVEAKGRRAEDRFAELVLGFAARIEEFADCCWVYVEVPMAGPNRKATIDQALVLGAIRGLFAQHSIANSLVNVSVWKKTVLGNGWANKEEIKAWACQHYTMTDTDPQDVFDATAIAAFGLKTGVLP